MNKLIRKITLSGVTLGVLALSTTTSTFAWFTTNSEATASNVSGTVSSSESNMLIKTYKNSSWTPFAKEVDFDAGSTALVPVTYQTKNTAGFYKVGSTNTDFSGTTTDKTEYLHYQVIFGLSSLATGLTNRVSLKTEDFKSDTDKEQYLLVDASTDGAKAGDTIKVNLLDVLSMRVESKLITSSDSNTYGINTTDIPSISSGNFNSTNSCYRYRAESTQVLTKTSSSDDFSLKNADALTYYNKVYNVTATRPTDDTPRGYDNGTSSNATNLVSTTSGGSGETPNSITLFTITGSEKAYVMCDIYFYIDGWDYQCFNAVGELQLDSGKLNFDLTTVTTG